MIREEEFEEMLLSDLNIIRLSEWTELKGALQVISLLLTYKYVILNWPDSAINKSPDNNTAKSNKMNGKITHAIIPTMGELSPFDNASSHLHVVDPHSAIDPALGFGLPRNMQGVSQRILHA